MSCTDSQLQIDRHRRVSAPGSEHELVRIRAHIRSCEHCAEYLESTEWVERMLRSLAQFEPRPDLSLRVMEQLKERVPEQAPQAEPSPGLVSPLLQHLLKNLSVLLACAALLASARADVWLHRLGDTLVSPRVFLGLSALLPINLTAVLFTIAGLLLLISLMTGPRPDPSRNRV